MIGSVWEMWEVTRWDKVIAMDNHVERRQPRTEYV